MKEKNTRGPKHKETFYILKPYDMEGSDLAPS